MAFTPDRFGVAVAGCGYWGINYLRVFRELPQIGNISACDPRVVRLKEIGEQFPDVTLARDVDDVLDSPDVDLVVVATPAASHYEVARRALEAGKHVLLEKPIAKTPEEAEALIEIAETQRLTLMVGHTFLYNPGIRRVKGYMDRGDIGRLYYLYSRRTNLGPIRDDVNALWDLAPHDIAIFSYLLGSRPTWVSAVGRGVLNDTLEDFGFVSVGYENGALGHIHVSWADPNKVREVVVVGSEQRIVFDDLKPAEPVRVYERGVTPAPPESRSYSEYSLRIRDGNIISPRIEVSEPLKNECLDFLECVTTGAPPLSDGHLGLEVVRVMQAIDLSMQRRGVPVSVSNGHESSEYLFEASIGREGDVRAVGT